MHFFPNWKKVVTLNSSGPQSVHHDLHKGSQDKSEWLRDNCELKEKKLLIFTFIPGSYLISLELSSQGVKTTK